MGLGCGGIQPMYGNSEEILKVSGNFGLICEFDRHFETTRTPVSHMVTLNKMGQIDTYNLH